MVGGIDSKILRAQQQQEICSIAAKARVVFRFMFPVFMLWVSMEKPLNNLFAKRL